MTIAQIQHLLAFLGHYTAPVDGVWGKRPVRRLWTSRNPRA